MEPRQDIKLQEFEAIYTRSGNREVVTVNIVNPNEPKGAQQGRRFNEDDDDDDDDELLIEDVSDTTGLLAGQKEFSPFWTFEYYKTFFNVETDQVISRIKSSLLPIPGSSFLRLHVRNNPDLYGPIWICATLIFSITISGNLSNFMLHKGHPKYHYVPKYRKVSFAATAIYAYAWLVPLALWCFLSWRNSKVINMMSYSFTEIACVYGYSLFIYIPISIFWIIYSELLRWVLMPFAMCQSGAILILAFWPAVREDDRKIAVSTLVVIMILNGLLAFGCGQYFFDRPEADHVQAMTNVTKGMPRSHQ